MVYNLLDVEVHVHIREQLPQVKQYLSHDKYTVPINANTNNNIKINFLPLNFRKRAPTPASMAPAKFNIAKNAPDIRIEKLTSAPFANPLIGAINTSQIPTGAVPVPLTTSPFSSNDAL